MLDFLDVGSLDLYLTIQERTETRDSDLNAIQYSYSTYANAYGKRIYKKASETIESDQDNEVISREYLIRYDPDYDKINARHRIVEESGDIFYVTGVDGGRREGYFKISAERRVST